MYYRDYGERGLAREVYAGLPVQARTRLTQVDYSLAERPAPKTCNIEAHAGGFRDIDLVFL